MQPNFKRSALLGSTALVGALAFFAAPAQAQMYSTVPGTYLSLEGRYLSNAGTKAQNYAYADDVMERWIPYDTSATTGKGWGGKAMLGYRFVNNWDIALGIAGGWLKDKDDAFTLPRPVEIQQLLPPNALVDNLSTRTHFIAVDFEAGYDMPLGTASTFRLFGGLRFAYLDQKAKGTVDHVFFLGGYHDYNGERKTSFAGLGPRIGANGTLAISGGFNMFGGLSGALLVGRSRDNHSFTYMGSGIDTGDSFTYKRRKTKLVPDVEGEIGLGYNFNAGGGGTTVGLQVGYRGEALLGAAPKGFVNGAYFKEKSTGDYLLHGPFVRLIATFGSPAPAPMASPPPVPPGVANSFIVFFDFDKSTITSAAQKTINDAVAAAKAGGSARVTLTGHTDRSGSEQYNLALSLRRAEAVKASMIKQGIPASAIVVIGKGESQPLVPTADGVREPQNRRVEIVI